MADYGRIDEIKGYGVIVWTRANPTPGGTWTPGYETGEAVALPECTIYALKVGDVVSLYRHGNEAFYGPPCGTCPIGVAP